MNTECMKTIDSKTKQIQLDFLVTNPKKYFSQRWQDYCKAMCI